MTNPAEISFEEYKRRLYHGGLFGSHLYYAGNNAAGIKYSLTLGGFGKLWAKDILNPRESYERALAHQA